MEVAEKITLGIAIFWALWQFLSIKHAAINGKTIFPAMIPSFIFFLISFAVVLA
jgi:hypothetical protein